MWKEIQPGVADDLGMPGSRACSDYISPEDLNIFHSRLSRPNDYHFLTGLNDLGWAWRN